MTVCWVLCSVKVILTFVALLLTSWILLGRVWLVSRWISIGLVVLLLWTKPLYFMTMARASLAFRDK